MSICITSKKSSTNSGVVAERLCLTEQLARATCQESDLHWRQRIEDSCTLRRHHRLCCSSPHRILRSGIRCKVNGTGLRKVLPQQREQPNIGRKRSCVRFENLSITVLCAGKPKAPFQLLHHGCGKPSRAQGPLAVGCSRALWHLGKRGSRSARRTGGK